MQKDDFKRDSRGVRKLGVYAKKYERDDEPGQMADLSALLKVSVEQISKRCRAGEPHYSNTPQGLQDLMQATQQYFQYIIDANGENEEKLVPDIEGWCMFLGITRQTMLNYARRGELWAESIAYIKDAILAAKKQLAFRFKIPAVVYLNDVSNNHNYFNTSEFRLTTQQVTGEDTLKPTCAPEEIVIRRKVMEKLEEEGRLLPEPETESAGQPPQKPDFTDD